MPTYSKSTPAQLRRRLQELEEELELACPTLVAEINLVRGLLKVADEGSAKTYASASGPKAAIDLCLDLSGDFTLTKREIIAEILAGGYMAAKPKAARGLVNDSLNHHIKKGLLHLDSKERVGRIPNPPSKNILAK
jgi:hypothetical protein